MYTKPNLKSINYPFPECNYFENETNYDLKFINNKIRLQTLFNYICQMHRQIFQYNSAKNTLVSKWIGWKRSIEFILTNAPTLSSSHTASIGEFIYWLHVFHVCFYSLQIDKQRLRATKTDFFKTLEFNDSNSFSDFVVTPKWLMLCLFGFVVKPRGQRTQKNIRYIIFSSLYYYVINLKSSIFFSFYFFVYYYITLEWFAPRMEPLTIFILFYNR